jgi:hypothetical protein
MLRCVGDAEVTHLPVADSGDMPSLDQRPAAGSGGIDQPERAVADAADDCAGRICFGDLGTQRLGEAQVVRGAPTAGQIDGVVRTDIDRFDGQRVGDLGPQPLVKERTIISRGADDSGAVTAFS